MHLGHRLVPLVLWCVACRPSVPPVTDLTFFDRIITRELVAAGYRGVVPVSLAVRATDSARIYQSDYEFPRTDSAQHYTSFITVAKAGVLLDPEGYQVRYAETKRSFADRGEDYLRYQFPRIGTRAQREIIGAGPGGAAFGLVFTTSDGRYDVRVTLSNLLPAGVADPGFDIDATARRIAERYDHR